MHFLVPIVVGFFMLMFSGLLCPKDLRFITIMMIVFIGLFITFLFMISLLRFDDLIDHLYSHPYF